MLPCFTSSIVHACWGGRIQELELEDDIDNRYIMVAVGLSAVEGGSEELHQTHNTHSIEHTK